MCTIMQSKDDHDIEAAPYLDDESIVVNGGAGMGIISPTSA